MTYEMIIHAYMDNKGPDRPLQLAYRLMHIAFRLTAKADQDLCCRLIYSRPYNGAFTQPKDMALHKIVIQT